MSFGSGQRRHRRAWRNAGILALVASMATVSLAAVPASAGGPPSVDNDPQAVPAIESPPVADVPKLPPGDPSPGPDPAPMATADEEIVPPAPNEDVGEAEAEVDVVPPAPNELPTDPSEPPEVPAEPDEEPVSHFVAGESVELVGRRDATTKVFENPDGTHTARVFGAPVHMRNDAGEWIEIDPEFELTADGRYRTKRTPTTLTLAPLGSDPSLARIVGDGWSVSFSLDGARPAPAVVVGNHATYPGVLPHVDLELSARPNGVKEDIVLASAQAQRRFVFPLDLDGVDAAVDPETGDVVYRRPNGDEVARTPHGVMEDSNVDPVQGDGAVSHGVSYSLIGDGSGGAALEVTLDDAWMDDPARVYPVRVDPTYFSNLDTPSWGDDTYVATGDTTDNSYDDQLKVGTTDGGTTKYRSYLHFSTGAVEGTKILGAQLRLRAIYSYSCTKTPMQVRRADTAWGGRTMTAYPGITSSALVTEWSFAQGFSALCPDDYVLMDVEPAVHDWATDAAPNYGLMLRAPDETENYQWKRFRSADYSGTSSYYPRLDIDYDQHPTINLSSPANGATLHSITPTLAVNGDDPDDDNVTLDYLYEVATDSGFTNVKYTSNWQNNDDNPDGGDDDETWQVPGAANLNWNQTYYWRVKVRDNNFGGTYPGEDPIEVWSGTRSFDTVNSLPDITARTPADEIDVLTLRPTLSVTASDADGDALKYQFLVDTGSNVSEPVVWTSGWTTSDSVQVPADTLLWNNTYYWRVEVDEQTPVDATGGPAVISSNVRSFDTVNDAPTVSLSSPASGSALHDVTPTFTVSGNDTEGDAISYQYLVDTDPAVDGTVVWTSGWVSGATKTIPDSTKLQWNRTYYWRVEVDDAYSNPTTSGIRSFTTPNTAPTVPAPQTPGTDADVASTTFSLQSGVASDPDGDTVKYQFQVATGQDGETGRLATSNWLTTPSWTPPLGTFSDGGAYSWLVRTQDPNGSTNNAQGVSAWSDPTPFSIDYRLGQRPQYPFDGLGPASVNLATGNLVVRAGGPSFGTVGGSIGASFVYNSQAPRVKGLAGDYYQDTDKDGQLDAGSDPRLLHRIDPQLNFNYGSPGDGPAPGLLNPEYWIARWTGRITTPPTNPGDIPEGESDRWVLLSTADDTVKITLGATTVLDTTAPGTFTSGPVDLTDAGGAPIDVTYTQKTKAEHFALKVRRPWQDDSDAFVVPADWYSPTQPSLPGGWARAGDSFVRSAYSGLRAHSDTSTVVLDAQGTEHLYTWTGSAWAPPKGERGTLSAADDGTWTLVAEDGMVYSFSAGGQLAGITPPRDGTNPGAPTYDYEPVTPGGPLRLTTVTDAFDRSIVFSYGPAGCPTASDFDPAPADMLCRISYADFGGGETRLYYSSAQLARIENPGGEVTDYGYDSSGRLLSVRAPLTNDLIGAGIITDPTSTRHQTAVAYDASNRVASVTAPVADAAMSEADRPQRSYDYSSGRTDVHVAGVPEPLGYSRRVDFDGKGRTASDTDATGKATTTEWDPSLNLVHSSTDPAGLKATTVYDAALRPTDSYGPAPASWFGPDRRPVANRVAQTPHTSTTYDGGIEGLSGVWFPNSRLSGAPVLRTTSGLTEDWGTGSPGSGVPADGFSGRLSGDLTLPSPGTLTLDADGARVVVDDEVVIDTWSGTHEEIIDGDGSWGWWPLNETSGTTATDAAGAGNTGTYKNGVTLGQPGAIPGRTATSARFDGVNDWVAADGAAVDLTGQPALSLEAWVRPASMDGGTVGTVLAFNTSSGSNRLMLRWAASKFDVYVDGTAYPAAATSTPDQWHHVAVTLRNDNTGTLSVDGVAAASFTTATRIGAGDTFSIGQEFDNATPSDFFEGSLDEVAVYPSALSAGRVAAHFGEGSATPPVTSSTLEAGTHEIRVDYQELEGGAHLSLTPSVAGASLDPLYGLVTEQVDARGKRAVTEFADPERGLATATVADAGSGGLGLRTTYDYEAAGSGFNRPTGKTLPRGNDVLYEHYGTDGNPATANVPCPGGATGVHQGGGLFRRNVPDAGRVREFVRDAAGRVVATRLNSEPWSCTTYDSRGRPVRSVAPDGKTTDVEYAAPLGAGGAADPSIVRVTATDSSGAARTTIGRVDWLGRPLSYQDEHDTVTRTTYDPAGRVTATYRAFAGEAETLLGEVAYDAAGRVTSLTEHLSGQPRTTTFGYDSAGRPTTVTRPNGVTTTRGYEADLGRLTSISHARSGQVLAQSTTTLDVAGMVTAETTDGSTRTYNYDGVGRLVRVDEGPTIRRYAYDDNGNRCAEAADCSNPTYTYDAADRLQSSPAASAYQYDAHGNVTEATLGDQPGPTQLDEQQFSFTTWGGSQSFPIVVGRPGTVSLDLAWGAMPVWRDGTISGDLAPGDTETATVRVGAPTTIDVPVHWDGGADVSVTLEGPDGSEVASQRSADGEVGLRVTEAVETPGDYTLEVENHSSGLTAEGLDAPWSATTTAEDTWAPTLPAGATRTRVVHADDQGIVRTDLSWDEDAHQASSTATGSIDGGATQSVTITPKTAGTITANLDWEPTARHTTTTGFVLVGQEDTGLTTTADGTISATLTWGSPLANLDLELLDGTGTVVDSSTAITGTSETVSYNVGDADPHDFTLRVKTVGLGANYELDYQYPVTPDLDLELWKGGTKVAETTTTAKPAALAHTIAASEAGTYTFRVVSTNGDDQASDYTLSTDYPVLDHADVTLSLKDASGTVLDSSRQADGDIRLTTKVDGAGDYTLEVHNHSAGLDAVEAGVEADRPKSHTPTMRLALEDSSGDVVGQTETATSPASLDVDVEDDDVYRIKVTPVSGYGQATLTGTHPGMPRRQRITYDAQDHAIQVDDGTNLTAEVLSPSGRVLRRTVSRRVSGEIIEDVIFGYSGPGDSPAYMRPAGGGTVTTYLSGPDGLLLIANGDDAQYPLTNAHGDVLGTTDGSGTYTATPRSNEYGVGPVSPDRLDWLGGAQRQRVGDPTGLIRMGVRLYDPNIGRFLAFDPVDGGSCNDYDYACGDPINNADLSGTTVCAARRCILRPKYDGVRHSKAVGPGVYHNGKKVAENPKIGEPIPPPPPARTYGYAPGASARPPTPARTYSGGGGYGGGGLLLGAYSTGACVGGHECGGIDLAPAASSAGGAIGTVWGAVVNVFECAAAVGAAIYSGFGVFQALAFTLVEGLMGSPYLSALGYAIAYYEASDTVTSIKEIATECW